MYSQTVYGRNTFKVKPEVFTREEKRAWLDKLTDVALRL